MNNTNLLFRRNVGILGILYGNNRERKINKKEEKEKEPSNCIFENMTFVSMREYLIKGITQIFFGKINELLGKINGNYRDIKNSHLFSNPKVFRNYMLYITFYPLNIF